MNYKEILGLFFFFGWILNLGVEKLFEREREREREREEGRGKNEGF